MLRIKDLSLDYGGIAALDGVSFDVPEGAVTTLVGSNGAGKTSVMKAILGLKAPSAGRVLLDETILTGLATSEIVKRGVVLVPEGRELFPRMSVEENLQLGGNLLSNRAKRRSNFEKVVDLFPVLGRKLGTNARNLSGGEQQMLAVGRALMGSPRFLLLDEPSIGLAPLIEEHLMASIRAVSQELGLGVLLVEQNAMLALEHSDHAFIIDLGRIVKQAPSAELIDDPDIVAAYLGGP